MQDGAAGFELLMGWLAFSVWQAGGEIFFPYKINYPENWNKKWTLYSSNKKKVILDIVCTHFSPVFLRAVTSKQKLHWTKLNKQRRFIQEYCKRRRPELNSSSKTTKTKTNKKIRLENFKSWSHRPSLVC